MQNLRGFFELWLCSVSLCQAEGRSAWKKDHIRLLFLHCIWIRHVTNFVVQRFVTFEMLVPKVNLLEWRWWFYKCRIQIILLCDFSLFELTWNILLPDCILRFIDFILNFTFKLLSIMLEGSFMLGLIKINALILRYKLLLFGLHFSTALFFFLFVNDSFGVHHFHRLHHQILFHSLNISKS